MAGYDLKSALQKLGEKPMNFGLYRGTDADQVLITSRAASGKQMEELEKECGDVKRLLKGVVSRKDGATVFATKAIAQPMYEKIIAAIFKERKCSAYLPIALRQLSAQESDEVTEDAGGTGTAPGAPAGPAAAPTPPSGKEEWDRLKAELIPQIRSALANAALKEPLTNLVREALGQEKAGAYPAAIAVFRKAQQMLGGGPTPGDTASPAPVAPPPPPPPPPARKRHSPRVLQAALNKLTPQIKRALAANPEAKEQILRPVADMQKQFKAGDTAAAQASLVKLTARLKSFGAFSNQAAS